MFAYKILIKLINTTQEPLKRKWTGSIDKSGKIHSAYMCLRMAKRICSIFVFHIVIYYFSMYLTHSHIVLCSVIL